MCAGTDVLQEHQVLAEAVENTLRAVLSGTASARALSAAALFLGCAAKGGLVVHCVCANVSGGSPANFVCIWAGARHITSSLLCKVFGSGLTNHLNVIIGSLLHHVVIVVQSFWRRPD
jgi:hypothetical protein